MGEPRIGWRCDEGQRCAPKGKPEITNLVIGVVDEDTSPDRRLDPGAVEITVTPLGRRAPPLPLRATRLDPKGGVDFRYEGIEVGWYRIRAFRRARPGGFFIVKEATRTVQVVKISRPVKPSDEHYAVTMVLRKPPPREKPKPRPLRFFQVSFMDKNEPDQGIGGLQVRLRLPGRPEPVEMTADPDGAVLLVEPDIASGQVDVLSIFDDRDTMPIVYDEFAKTGLLTDVVNVIEMPDKRKVAGKIAAAQRIKRRWDWGAVRQRKPRTEQDWDYSTVVIHHSGGWGTKDPKKIQKMHMDDNGWEDIGYHYLVHPDGTIYEGRFVAYKGSHVANRNTGKIGICMLGDFKQDSLDPQDFLTKQHLDMVEALIKTLQLQFPLRVLAGHQDYPPAKGCPGSQVYEKLDALRASTGLARP